MRHIFILDTKYFHEQQWKMDSIYDNIGQFFRTQAKPEFTTHTPHYPRQAIGIIQEQADKAKEGDTIRVYAIGGDEIFFDCLNSTVGLPNSEFAIVPSGNTSDFMRIFGIAKADLTKDFKTLTASPAIPTDLISVDNWFVLNGCFIGFLAADARKKKELSLDKKSRGPAIVYRGILGFSNKFFTAFNKEITTRHYKITIDGKDYSGNYCHIGIVNGPYFGGNKTAAPKAMPNDGLLDVVLIKSGRALATLFSVSKYSRGKEPANCISMQAKKITVQSDEPVWVQMDGEFIRDTLLTFEVVPEAIKIVTPGKASYAEARGSNSEKK